MFSNGSSPPQTAALLPGHELQKAKRLAEPQSLNAIFVTLGEHEMSRHRQSGRAHFAVYQEKMWRESNSDTPDIRCFLLQRIILMVLFA